MAEELQEAFINRVETRDWITNSTKALIKEKAKEMIIAIGAPENVSSLNFLVSLDSS
jgi:predicted metalloendopeptidase